MERKEFQRKVSLGDIVLITYQDSKNDRLGYSIGRFAMEQEDTLGVSLTEDLHHFKGSLNWGISALHYYRKHITYEEILKVYRLVESKKLKSMLEESFGQIPKYIKARDGGIDNLF